MSYADIIFSRFDFVLLQIVLQEAEIMNQGKTVFAQIMSLIPRYEFDKCVKRYNGNRHVPPSGEIQSAASDKIRLSRVCYTNFATKVIIFL